MMNYLQGITASNGMEAISQAAFILFKSKVEVFIKPGKWC
jgi:hypothetical protein